MHGLIGGDAVNDSTLVSIVGQRCCDTRLFERGELRPIRRSCEGGPGWIAWSKAGFHGVVQGRHLASFRVSDNLAQPVHPSPHGQPSSYSEP